MTISLDLEFRRLKPNRLFPVLLTVWGMINISARGVVSVTVFSKLLVLFIMETGRLSGIRRGESGGFISPLNALFAGPEYMARLSEYGWETRFACSRCVQIVSRFQQVYVRTSETDT